MRHHAVLTMSVMIAITFVFSYVPELFVPGRLALTHPKPHLTFLSADDARIDGQNMDGRAWLCLATRLNTLLKDDDVQGAVVTHGIDTIEETAYFLNLVVDSDKPVVLAGSTAAAVAAAADPRAHGRGVLIAVEHEIRAARSATLAGVVQTSRIIWFARPEQKHTSRSEFSIDGVKTLPRVDIIYAHADMSPDLIRAALKHGAQGLVIAGMADGNMQRAALDALAHAAKRGIVVVRRAQVDARGFIASGDIDAPKSRVLLQLALTQTKDPARIQRMFDDY